MVHKSTTFVPSDGSATWGSINGDIENQSDLQAEFATKASVDDLATVAFTGSFNDLVDTPDIVNTFNSESGPISLNAGTGITIVPSGGGIFTVNATGGGGSGVSSVNSLTGGLTLAAGANVTITDNGTDTITIAASGGGGGAVDSVNGQTGVVVLDTDDIAEGSTNLYYSSSLFNTDFATKDTDDLTEGSTNLYFTNARALSATVGSYVALTGDQSVAGVKTFTSLPESSVTPTTANQLVNKSYVDTVATTGARFVGAVNAATTAALPSATYSNGSSGVGATLTRVGNGAFPTTDGVAAALNNLYLIKNQASGLQNGVYTLTQLGSASLPWILTRVSTYDTSAEIVTGTFFNVLAGTTNGNTQWSLTTTGTITIGTTDLVFEQFNQLTSYTANNGITLTGVNFALGGTLTSNTTIDHGAFNLTHNLSSTGDFIIQDAGTTVFQVDDTGFARVGSAVTGLGQLAIQPTTSSVKGLVVRGAASQTANLQDWQSSAGTILGQITSAGKINFSQTNINDTSVLATLSLSPATVQQESNTGADYTVSTLWWGYKFTIGASDIQASTLLAYLRRDASGTFSNPTATITGRLYSDSAGLPGTALGSAQSIALGSVSSSSYTSYQFAVGTQTLTAGTTYWAIFRLSATPTGSTLYHSATATGTAKVATSANGTAWTAVDNFSLRFALQGVTGTALSVTSPNGIAAAFSSTNTTAASFASTNGVGGAFSTTNGTGLTATSTYGTGASITATNGIGISLSSGGTCISGTVTGTTGSFISGNLGSSNGTGISITGTGTGTGVTLTMGSGIGSSITVNPTTTNTIHEMNRYTRTTTGTAAAGLGAANTFYLESASGTSLQASSQDMQWTDATAATSTSQYEIRLRNNNALPASGSGQFQFNGNGDFRLTRQLVSPLTTGTSPFNITSTTVNTNLNADLLDGQHGSYYNDLANATGNLAVARLNSGTGATSSTFWRGDGTWAVAGAGTVTSVGLSAPAEFTVSGSPVTGSGTLTFTKANQNANLVYAGPTTGAAAAPTFRSLVAADIPDISGTYIPLSQKGANSGVATLDSGGKIPSSQLPSTVMEFKGTWSAATNTPTLTDGIGDAGDVYLCNAAGTVDFGAGPITFAVGDWVVYSGSVWEKSINSNSVVSVNGQQGVVVLTTTDISEGTNLYYTNARGIGSTLTGYTSGAGTVSSSDTILQAIQKLNGNTVALSGVYQPLDATLTALAALNTTAGYLVQTGTDTFTKRTLTGTANQISITNGDGTTGNPVFSLPQDIATSSAVTFDSATLNNATLPIALRPAVEWFPNDQTIFEYGNDTGTVYADGTPLGLYWSNGDVGNNRFEFRTQGGTYQNVSAGYFIANSGFIGDGSNISGLSAGNISSGTLVAARGGTGQSSYAVGDILYASATTTLSKLAGVATGNALISGGVTTAPSWGKIGLTTHVSGVLPLANGGSNANLTAVNGGIVYSTASAMAISAAGSSGQILRSGGAGAPTWSTATFPSTAATTGAYLRADGTNWIASTLILPNAATANQVVYATSTDTYGGSANLTFDGTSLGITSTSATAISITGSGGGIRTGVNGTVKARFVQGMASASTADDILYLNYSSNLDVQIGNTAGGLLIPAGKITQAQTYSTSTGGSSVVNTFNSFSNTVTSNVGSGGTITAYGINSVLTGNAAVAGGPTSQSMAALRGVATTSVTTNINTNNFYGVQGLSNAIANGGTITNYGGHFTATGDTGGTSTAVGLYATASGADTNWAAQLVGTSYASVGLMVGDTVAPTTVLHVTNSSAGNGAIIGNVFTGNWNGGSTFAAFSHSSFRTTSNSYALLQASNGTTYLNAASGQNIEFRTNNSASGFIDSNLRWFIGATSVPSSNINHNLLVTASGVQSACLELSGSATNSVRASTRFRHRSSADMVDGFGAGCIFTIQDSANISNDIGIISAVREGADSSGTLQLGTYNATVISYHLKISKTGRVIIGDDVAVANNGLLELETTTTDGIPCLYLDQNDTDQPFVGFEGTSGSDSSFTNSVSTRGANATSGSLSGPNNANWTHTNMLKINVNGTILAIPTYAATGS